MPQTNQKTHLLNVLPTRPGMVQCASEVRIGTREEHEFPPQEWGLARHERNIERCELCCLRGLVKGGGAKQNRPLNVATEGAQLGNVTPRHRVQPRGGSMPSIQNCEEASRSEGGSNKNAMGVGV